MSSDLFQIVEYSPIGLVVLAFGVIVFLVNTFMKFIRQQENNYNNTITNHLNEQKKAHQELTQAIRELIAYLKGINQ